MRQKRRTFSSEFKSRVVRAALREDKALATGRRPEIFNTDQGSQFTSLEFTGLLKNTASQSTWMA